MNKISIHNLFPTPVGEFCYDKDISKFREICQTYEPQEGGSGNRYATHDVLSYPDFKDLRGWIDDSIAKYYKEVFNPIDYDDQEIYITESWVNYCNSNESHAYHKHVNSLISGVFYLEGNDAIEFKSPKPYNQIEPEVDSFNEYNADTWWLPARAAMLYLWPSWLVHGVPTADREEERISVAFNVFVKGTVSGRVSTQLVL